MKKFFTALALAFFVFVQFAHAVTVYYQPTPYPALKADGTNMPQAINIVHVWDGWFNNSYNQTFVQDDKLQIGGWGDNYVSLIKFDLTGLPSTTDSADLYLWALPSGAAGPSQVSLWPITSVWDPATVGWGNFVSVDSGYYWPVSTVVNSFRGYSVTGWYNDWKSGARSNQGILVWPYNNDGTQRFDKFASSRNTNDGQRPLLALTFTPTLQLKMPLPGGYSWLLTNEIGGYECKGDGGISMWPDVAHADNGSTGNYYSIDVTWTNNGTQYGQYNTPVLAAAGGKVIEVGGGNNPGDFNGFYIVIDHDGDGNINTGFSTRYLHLKQYAARANGNYLSVGDSVNQGDQIGVMGTTGKDTNGISTSSGVHLHFGVRYQNHGYSYIPELTKVTMENNLLKSYQTECGGTPSSWIRYYGSTNTPTGQ